MLDRLRHTARLQQRDLFFFDNGDINDGTGLSASAEDHVTYLAPVMRAMQYDALNMGNHELYQRNGHGIWEKKNEKFGEASYLFLFLTEITVVMAPIDHLFRSFQHVCLTHWTHWIHNFD